MLNEPRGGVFRHVNLLVPPKNPEAQMGFIIMEPADTPPMSGANSICVVTVLLDAGITRDANEQLGFRHPEQDWNHISFCQLTDPVERTEMGLSGKSAVAIRPGKINRSPTGTGCSARMAVPAAKGMIRPGDPFTSRSMIDTEFHCRIDGLTRIGNRPAIMPVISGRAWISGTHQLMMDPGDPFPLGLSPVGHLADVALKARADRHSAGSGI